MNICLVSDNDVMEHFAFLGNINFATDDQGAFSCIIHEMLLCLFIVCETMFAIVESRTINKHSKCLQILAEERFSVETPLENAG